MAEKLAATNEEAFNFASYMKERAQLVNEALDKSVPLQYPEVINESMRQAHAALTGRSAPVFQELWGSLFTGDLPAPCTFSVTHRFTRDEERQSSAGKLFSLASLAAAWEQM